MTEELQTQGFSQGGNPVGASSEGSHPEGSFSEGSLSEGRQPFSVSGATLKIIAIVTMLIDHLTAVLVFPAFGAFSWSTGLYEVGRGIGRLAFPIFCFLLAEGFYYTRDRKKYLIRLLIFAAISEIPFDLAFSATVFDRYSQNVFFTLFLGGLAVSLLEYIEGDRGRGREAALPRPKNVFLRFIAILAVVFACAIAAEFLNTDYSSAGVATIIIMYVLAERKKAADPVEVKKANLFAFAVGVFVLGLTCGKSEYWAFADLIPLYFYNGTRGRQMRYFFYAFYPVHLLIIGIIAMVFFRS